MTKIKKQKVRVVNIEPTILKTLKDPEVAASYIRECLSEKGPSRRRLLLRALMDVARARGIGAMAKGSESKRRLIYKALAEKANPSIMTLESILNDLELTIDIKPLKHVSAAA